MLLVESDALPACAVFERAVFLSDLSPLFCSDKAPLGRNGRDSYIHQFCHSRGPRYRKFSFCVFSSLPDVLQRLALSFLSLSLALASSFAPTATVQRHHPNPRVFFLQFWLPPKIFPETKIKRKAPARPFFHAPLCVRPVRGRLRPPASIPSGTQTKLDSLAIARQRAAGNNVHPCLKIQILNRETSQVIRHCCTQQLGSLVTLSKSKIKEYAVWLVGPIPHLFCTEVRPDLRERYASYRSISEECAAINSSAPSVQQLRSCCCTAPGAALLTNTAGGNGKILPPPYVLA